MRAWTTPDLPELPVTAPAVRLHDTASGELVELVPADGTARLYVCGITPYDATHLGHANTYVAFDLLHRAWRSAGHDVRYVQNVTDVDDPLLERAAATGMDWQALAERETDLFRTDMEALRVIAPHVYLGVVESIDLVVDMIAELERAGTVYRVEDDLYFEVRKDADFGAVSGWDVAEMLRILPERGGDPERPGKRDPLDCLLWRAERPGEPAWDSPWGPGRPGWHVECSAIARAHLGTPIDVQGGGSDLIFPHHEMSAAEAQVADGRPFARVYSHSGMVALDGEKMSKSKGNLELVSRLREQGVDPMAVRVALLGRHYRSDWEWTPALLEEGELTLGLLRDACAADVGLDPRESCEQVLAAMADDLDAPRALDLLRAWAERSLRPRGDDTMMVGAGRRVAATADAALGLLL